MRSRWHHLHLFPGRFRIALRTSDLHNLQSDCRWQHLRFHTSGRVETLGCRHVCIVSVGLPRSNRFRRLLRTCTIVFRKGLRGSYLVWLGSRVILTVIQWPKTPQTGASDRPNLRLWGPTFYAASVLMRALTLIETDWLNYVNSKFAYIVTMQTHTIKTSCHIVQSQCLAHFSSLKN